MPPNGTVGGPLLTQKSPTYAYISCTFNIPLLDFSVEKKVLLLRKVMVSRCIFSTLYYSLREFSFFFLFFLLSWILVQCFLSLCLKLDLGNITLQDIPITQVRTVGGMAQICIKSLRMHTQGYQGCQKIRNFEGISKILIFR